MRLLHLIVAISALVCIIPPNVIAQQSGPTEIRIPANGASLFARVIGEGPPLIVLHGGPDFDHRYLLPDLDRLKDVYRLIYYDQRGRGKSADNVRPEDVSLASEIEDLDKVRQHFRLDAVALLGHSWGAVLALEYALRHPTRVSQLIVMNPAPANGADLALSRKDYLAKLGPDMDRQREIAGSAAYVAGEPAAVTARYRIHFKHALASSESFERLMASMKIAFEAQGKEGIVKARAVEDRLYLDTWQAPGYDLLPRLRTLKIPVLVITGDHDFFPVEMAEHFTQALPDARLVVLRGCGHFTYLECPREVHAALQDFNRRRK